MKYHVDTAQDRCVLNISGLQVHLRGLSALNTVHSQNPALVILLHGRTSSVDALEALGSAILAANKHALVVSFDQRNHGHRIVSPEANLTWLDGNEMHA